MDISLVASTLLPFLIKGGEKIAELIGEGFWTLIKTPFSKPKAAENLKRLEQNPDDQQAKTIVQYEVEKVLEERPDLLQKLSDVLKNIPVQKPNTMNITGNDNNAFQDVTNSPITITRNGK